MTTMNSMPPSQILDTATQTGQIEPSPKDAIKIITWANEQFAAMKSGRWQTEKQWYLNLAFYFGQQNVAFKGGVQGVSRDFKLYTPPAPYYRSRPIINLVRPRLRQEMAKLTGQKPTAFVVPASSDDRDMYAANAGEQIWDSLYRSKKIHSVIRRSVFWTCITGNGFIKSYWDEDAEDSLSDQLGDIAYTSETPFHVYVPDLQEEDIEFQPYVFHVSNRSSEQLSNIFGKEIKFEESANKSEEQTFLNAMGIENWKKNKNVLVMECWVKPGQTKKYPKGAMFTIAGNQLISYTEGWPYEHNKFPFAHIGHVASGKFYRDSIIVDLIPLQKEYNRTRGQIIESKNRMAKPQLAAEIGSIDPNKITSEPGQIILYRPGFQPPQPIPLQSLPSYVLQEQERIKTDMDEISGQHEVSRGQVPPGITAATAISYLQEQDESKLSYTFDSLEEGIEKVAYMTLNYVHQFWDTPRKVKVTGADGSFDVMAFEGSELEGNTDIRIEAGSALPTSKAAKQAFIMDLMKMGFIDPNKGLEVMEIGGINKIYEQVQTDVRQAQRENLKMAQVTEDITAEYEQTAMQQVIADHPNQQMLMQGPDNQIMDMSPTLQGGAPEPVNPPLIVPVNTWDEHRIHIERHNNYRKSQAFDNLPDIAKKLFEEHVKQHVSAIMVGAAGALPPELLDPNMMQQSNNLESYKQTAQQMGPPQPSQSPQPPSGGQPK